MPHPIGQQVLRLGEKFMLTFWSARQSFYVTTNTAISPNDSHYPWHSDFLFPNQHEKGQLLAIYTSIHVNLPTFSDSCGKPNDKLLPIEVCYWLLMALPWVYNDIMYLRCARCNEPLKAWPWTRAPELTWGPLGLENASNTNGNNSGHIFVHDNS